MAEKKKNLFRVKGIDLDLDGKRHAEGETIELADEPSEQLARHLEPLEPQKDNKQ